MGLIFFQAFHFFARQQIIPSNIPPQIPNYHPTETILTEKVKLDNSENTAKPIKEVEIIKNQETGQE